MKGKLFVVSGPSGVGKTVLCSRMLEKFSPAMVYSISTTSRSPRGAEKEGQEYFFYSREQFEQAIKEDAFAEWAKVHDNYYGTPKRFIEEKTSGGLHVLLNIDVQGALKLRKVYPEAVLVFIMPPSLAVLEERLRKRNTDPEEVLQRRLANAREEMNHQKDYPHVLINDDLQDCSRQLSGIFRQYMP